MRGFPLWCIALYSVILIASPAAGALDRVRVQLKWLHQFQFAGYYAAVEKGFYREAGLDVTLLEGMLHVDPAHVVLDGGAEFGVGTPDILLLRAEGKPLVVLGVIFQHSPYIFLELEKSDISDIGDMVGKRLMIEPQAAELYAYLANERVPLSSLTILPHSFSVEDLINGKADAMSAYITDEPFALYQAGIPYSTFTPRSGGVDFYGDCFFTTEFQVKQFPERTRAFYEATLRGWNYAFENPDEIIDLILRKYSKRKSREALKFEADLMRELIHPEIIPIGYMYEGRWRHIMETYEDLDMLKKPVSLKGFLYDPNPKADRRWLYWMGGIAFATAVLTLGVVLPIWGLNRKLKVAKDAADAANSAKSRFVATVSHELRTPMNGVVGFAGLLSRTRLSEEQRGFVQLIDSSAQSLVTLIDDLLDFSKIEAGCIELEKADFSLRLLLDEVSRSFEPVAGVKGLSLRRHVASGVPEFVRGDSLRIRQILFNLLGNSLKFTSHGTVTLDVQAESGAEGVAIVTFRVIDTGTGLSAEEMSRVFEPFSQANASIHRQYGGTGLGLTISKRLVELMGGELTMTSEQSAGTTVFFTLPLLPVSEIAPVSVAPVQPSVARLPLASWDILVAEDDPVSAKLMRSLLTRMGHRPTLAVNGSETLERWESMRPRVVFMDMQMPAPGGVECIQHIRRHEELAKSEQLTKIIALTANADSHSREACLAAGVDVFLTKPVSLEEIEKALVF